MHNRSKPQRGTPESIIARLYALAGLAEKAAVRVWIVRLVVLWILRRAETTISGYVLDCAWRAGLDELGEQIEELVATEDYEGSVAEALRLACTFRALAMILTWLVANGLIAAAEHAYFRPACRLDSARARQNARRISGRRHPFAYQISGRPEVRRVVLPGYS